MQNLPCEVVAGIKTHLAAAAGTTGKLTCGTAGIIR